MKRVCIIGHFGFGKNLLNGQTIKTKIITTELEKQLGAEEVEKIDIAGGMKKLPALFFKSAGALKRCKNVIIMPVENGLMFFAPVLTFWNNFFHRKLHYVVIGGWLPQFISNKGWLQKRLKKFDCMYVETLTMKRALEGMGFTNVTVMPNCKELKILKPEELVYPEAEPYKLCTFSRVMKEKGIEDIVNAVQSINEKNGSVVFELDIYGQVDEGQARWFEELKSSFPQYIRYGSLVPFDESVEVLKNYFALVFPTRFYTEGVPGTIIDAYAAGVPVISSMWESFDCVVDDKETGIGVKFNDYDELVAVLERIAGNPTIITAMKPNCINRASDFTAQAVVGEKLCGYMVKI